MPRPPYYHRVRDITLPAEAESVFGNENIILTVEGMKELSAYYHQKYGIDIIPFAARMRMDGDPRPVAATLCELISEQRAKVTQEQSYRCGFVLHNTEAGEHGHAMPIIWEKEGEKERLFFLDTGQYLGNVSYDSRECDFIVQRDFSHETDLESLPGTSRIAFVVGEEGVFFVDKDENSRKNLSAAKRGLFSSRPPDTEMIDNVCEFAIDQQLANGGVMILRGDDLTRMRALTRFDINYGARNPQEFRNEISRRNPNLELWSHQGVRQLDHSSCTTDAMVMLKDGLRMDPPLSTQAQRRKIGEKNGVNLFYMPESLLKTAQIGSFAAEKSEANPEAIIHTHHVKDGMQQRTEETVPVTLKAFRQQHEVPVSVKISGREVEQKNFGTYTLTKGKRFAKILDEREKKQMVMEMRATLQAMRTVSSSTDHLLQTIGSVAAKEQCRQKFLCAHAVMLEEDRRGLFGCVRKTHFNPASSLETILESAKNNNNRSRAVCVKLGWTNSDGTLAATAPDPVKESYPQVNTLRP